MHNTAYLRDQVLEKTKCSSYFLALIFRFNQFYVLFSLTYLSIGPKVEYGDMKLDDIS